MRLIWVTAIAFGCGLQLSDVAIAQERDASTSDLLHQLSDKDVERRRDAAYELVRRAEYSDDVILAWGEATGDDDVQVRVQSLTGLARAGSKSQPVIPALLKCLGSREEQIRYRAAVALGAIGNSAIEPLKSHWASASSASKIAAAQAFAIMGEEARTAIPLLQQGLNDSGGLPRFAAEALLALCPQDEFVLLKIAEHNDPLARKVGISGLASLKSPSSSATQKLRMAASDSDPKIRETAIIAIAKSSLPSAEKATLIEAALLDLEAPVRAAAIVALRHAHLPADGFAQQIARRLQTVEIDAAHTLLKAIALLGPTAHDVLPELLAVSSRTGMDQRLVSQALASFGAEVVPELLSAIEKYPANEPTYSQALGLIGQPAVPSLTRGIASKVEVVRIASARALGGVRPLSQEIVKQLVSACSDESFLVREVAVTSLISSAKQAEFAKDTLMNATRDAAPNVRAAAVQSMRSFEFKPEDASQAIERGLLDESPAVRTSALTVLGDMPALLQARSEQLATLVKDSDVFVRAKAASTIGKLGKRLVTDSIVSACVTALGDSDRSVKISATESVKSLGISEVAVLDALSTNLADDLELLQVTLEAIAGFGEKAARLTTSVSQLASHEKAEVRVAALNALAVIEKDRKTLAGRFTEALEDKEWEVRRIAGIALGKLGPDAKNAVPKLFRLLGSDEDRDFASGALKEINTAPVEAIPLLMEKLEADDRRTSFYAVSLLGKIGPPAAEALPKLEAMLARPGGDAGRSDFRKRFLVEAIAAIKGESKSEK